MMHCLHQLHRPLRLPASPQPLCLANSNISPNPNPETCSTTASRPTQPTSQGTFLTTPLTA
jgi:hypothetical protein